MYALVALLLLFSACSPGPLCVLEPMCYHDPADPDGCVSATELCTRDPEPPPA
jgi:hypothetical protein